LRNRKRFLSRTCPSTITSLSFLPGVIIEDITTSDRTPVSQKNGPFFMAEDSEFCGSGGYLWSRRLNRFLEVEERIYIIYWDNFNVKGLDLHALWLSSCNFLIDLPLMKGRHLTGFLHMFTGDVIFSVKCFLAL
jgi:hypothetical protein